MALLLLHWLRIATPLATMCYLHLVCGQWAKLCCSWSIVIKWWLWPLGKKGRGGKTSLLAPTAHQPMLSWLLLLLLALWWYYLVCAVAHVPKHRTTRTYHMFSVRRHASHIQITKLMLLWLLLLIHATLTCMREIYNIIIINNNKQANNSISDIFGCCANRGAHMHHILIILLEFSLSFAFDPSCRKPRHISYTYYVLWYTEWMIINDNK